jgi:uncharacterized protein (TIGR00255 family)
MRKIIQGALSRGHIDVKASYRNNSPLKGGVKVNLDLLKEYIKVHRHMARTLSMENDLELSKALRLPDVMTLEESEDDGEAILALAKDALLSALESLKTMRRTEGQKLVADIKQRIANIDSVVDAVNERAPMICDINRKN